MTSRLAGRIIWPVLVSLAIPVSARNVHRPDPLSLSENQATVELRSAEHDIGRLYLRVTNYGRIGPDEYPRGSHKGYLFEAGLVVGAVVDGDTLVSTSVGPNWGLEFNPAPGPEGSILFRSTIDSTRPWIKDAVSHQDFVTVYTDTCTSCPFLYYDAVDGRLHQPLWIEVTQKSYAWAYEYAQDFVLFDFAVKNIGDKRLREIYIGMFVDGNVHTGVDLSAEPRGVDDVVGFLEYFPAMYLGDNCPPDSDLINVGWTSDDDGNGWRPQLYAHVQDVAGFKIIRAPRDSLHVTFNWWSTSYYDDIFDFGPQTRAGYRTLPWNSSGTPWGDRATYYFLRNGERDYDEYLVPTMTSLHPIWVPPREEWRDTIFTGWNDAPDVGLMETNTVGLDPCYLLSFGPFGLEPGQSLPLTFAYVAGTHFHRDAHIYRFLPDYPEIWGERIWFDRLALNAMWAQWIYDNPGVDTDSDGYAGEFTVCNLGQDSTWKCDTLVDFGADPDTNYIVCYWDYSVTDTVWRTGDGVPDFRGAYPPPSPSTYRYVNNWGDTLKSLRVYPETGRIRLVWNGVAAETTPDPFSHQPDFEGYKVYIAHDTRRSSFSVATTYDLENWSRWQWNAERHRFICPSAPFALEQLRCLYADSCGDTTWHPDRFTRDNPLIIQASPKAEAAVYYFEPMGYNRSILANDPVHADTEIRKVYPDAPKPPFVHPDSIAAYYPERDDTTYFTEEGFLKYYEYEYVFEDILPTVVYYVNVTAFDHGYPELGLSGLESDPTTLPKAVYPLPSSEVIAEQGLGVFVYPNPYRLDADYRERGYEAVQRWHVPEDKTRLIHFANLPPKCTIRILSLDGDLIRELKHDVDPADYTANHDTWNLINRNMQLVVTGLYYWTVEDDRGNTQIGKLVIIM